MALDYPAFGQSRACNELRKQGVFISACGVRSVWQRHDLEVFDKRLKHLEARVAEEGLILTEAQLIALERKKERRESLGEIETEHPGYLGSQDTYYVGNIKGVGRIYQQTFIDTYSRLGFAKLYETKHAITSADILNDRVLPFFEEHEIPLLRILTDRGTEYKGKPELITSMSFTWLSRESSTPRATPVCAVRKPMEFAGRREYEQAKSEGAAVMAAIGVATITPR